MSVVIIKRKLLLAEPPAEGKVYLTKRDKQHGWISSKPKQRKA